MPEVTLKKGASAYIMYSYRYLVGSGSLRNKQTVCGVWMCGVMTWCCLGTCAVVHEIHQTLSPCSIFDTTPESDFEKMIKSPSLGT